MGYKETQHKRVEYLLKNTKIFYRDKGNGYLTNHTLSSQVACLNHLFPIRNDKDAVLSIVQQVCPDIVEVLPNTTDKYLSAYIQFESICDVNHLNERCN